VYIKAKVAMMSERARTGLRIAVLVFFVTITLGINFAHTEKSFAGGKDCPACHFLTSSVSIGPGVVLMLPALLCQGTLPAVEHCRTFEVVVLFTSSRSPPQA
jgi:hypothetical protein